MTKRISITLFLLGTALSHAADAPLRALLVCGGCCHDYGRQSVILRDGIQARANIQVDVVLSADRSTKPYFPMYENKDWAKGYDVVIHDECAADIKEMPYVQNIVDSHRNGLPAVNIHCAMHSYRTGTDLWFSFLGLQSSSHGWKKPIDLDFSASEHPITKGLTNWTTLDEELYNNLKIFDTAKSLILGSQVSMKGQTETSVVAWTNDYHGTRVFCTTLGHENKTVSDDRYLNLIVRGVLWSCDKLNPEYLKPYAGPNGKFETLPAPVAAPAAGAAADAEKKKPVTDLGKSGNTAPVIEKLTPQQEAAILQDVKVAEGFDVSLFSTSSAANYPVYVAASPAGDLYVSSDGNGSLGREASRGRILRLRDTDKDGRADQVTEFVSDVTSPRGLVWDHDRLYLLHPPDISVYTDKNGDGITDEKKTLIQGIAFGFKDRPADHSTNGLSLGIDGWLYIAGGDFGFMNATGTDGKQLQHRAGGVIRFRPDGTGLETFSTGTRNILGTPISPLLDLFARDNTNDGGGWDVRFHHFTGLEDHGYPRLYMNFRDEIIQPLADYGGGSGCGSVYLSEPGFPAKWNDAPLTCDWGSGALWRHTVQPNGATFVETAKPEPLIKMTRPTDADVDAMSAIYQASWKGATFKWEGPNVGYIVRVTPKGYTPEALPDFEKASDAELIRLLESSSQVRTLEAQRALLRRPGTSAMRDALLVLASAKDKPLPARVAALYALTQRAVKSDAAATILGVVRPLAADEKLGRFVLRALGDAGLDGFANGKTTAPEDLYSAGLKSSDPRTRLEALVGATRQNMKNLAPQMATQLGDADPVVAHTAFRAISMLGTPAPCFAILDNPKSTAPQRLGAARALMRMHQPEVVAGLISRLEKATESARREEILAALCRLHFHEGIWKGDSWGTRPDTRGPYYQPEPWAATPQIATALKAALAKASPPEAAFLARELQRNRIEFSEARDRIMDLAKDKPELLPQVVDQLAMAEEIPERGIPYLLQAVKSDGPPEMIAKAVSALSKTGSAEGCVASLAALEKLKTVSQPVRLGDISRNAFLAAPKLENHHQVLEEIAAKMEGTDSLWADAALLALSGRKTGSPESRELSQRALDHGWPDAKRRRQILMAIRLTSFQGMNDRVLAALDDADPHVAAAATEVARILKLEKKGEDKSPVVSTLKPEQVIADVMKTKGDVELGKQLFTRQSCVNCHAVTLEEPQKGPYLGTIAQTYTRGVLAENIMDPGKTIAQGFASELFVLKDGTSQMGFVTFEGPNEVKIRNIAAQEFVLKSGDIVKRDKLPNSLMPPGLVSGLTTREFASLLDYLESLSKK
jgi:putative membrane-bound dehydrogenase-like protein